MTCASDRHTIFIDRCHTCGRHYVKAGVGVAQLSDVAERVARSDVLQPATPATRRWWPAIGGALLVGYLFAGYLAIARTTPANADGASNAMQAWDMLHGN